MLIGPRVREGSHGYHVITPLMRSDGSTVLIDRGFISKDKVDKAGHLLETGEVQIFGMLRTAQAKNSFTPNNLPDEGVWYWTDVDAMAEYAGGEAARVQPVFVEQIFGKSNSYTLKSRALNRASLRLQMVMQEKLGNYYLKEYHLDEKLLWMCEMLTYHTY